MYCSVFRVLIVDSVMALFRIDFSGRGELATRQQTLGKHLADLKKMAEEFNLAVVSSCKNINLTAWDIVPQYIKRIPRF